MIIWTLVQLLIFVVLMVLFILSPSNPFMKESDCCTADQSLTRAGNDLPLRDCANLACSFESFGYPVEANSNAWLFQDLPQNPLDGEASTLFEYGGEMWCCNLSANDESCCSHLPYGAACGAVMWMSGFAAVCGMIMTQVVLQGFYSFCSRRSAWWTTVSVVLGMGLRLIVFVTLFYFFWGFMFAFLFFFYPMLQCDNQHAFDWWRFGYLYVYYWFDNFGWIIQHGLTEWDGEMDFDTLIATHTSLAVIADGVFALIYVLLSKIKDSKGQAYFHLTWFKL